MKPFKSIFFALSFIAIATFISCSPSIKTSAVWVNKDKIKPQPNRSVMIVVLSQNLKVKSLIENDLASAATARGIKAYKSITEFGPIATQEGLPLKDLFLQKVKDLNCDAIFAIRLLNKESQERYVQGSSISFTPYPMYGYYGSFSGYYGYGYGSSVGMYNPGYYTTDKTYFVEANLYDAKTEEVLASIQSKAENPPAIEKSSKLYTQSLIDELVKYGLLKK